MQDLPPKRFDEKGVQPTAEYKAHSFIVKVWIEEAANQSERTTWRGRITHVPGGERRYLQDLNEVALFIAPYLGAIGERPRLWERVKRWLSR